MAMASQSPLTAGQSGLLFPAAYLVNYYFLGGRDWFGLFTPATADQIIAQEHGFRACFTAGGIGGCGVNIVAFLILFSIGGALYGWLRKGGLAANGLNLGLAAVMAIAMAVLEGGRPFTWVIAAGWLLLAAIGLYDVYRAKGAAEQPPEATP
jgi:hypothetical protein